MANRPVVDLTGASDNEEHATSFNRWPTIPGSSTRTPVKFPKQKIVDLTKEDDKGDASPKQLASRPAGTKATEAPTKNETTPPKSEIHFLAKPYSSSTIQSMIVESRSQSVKKDLNHVSISETKVAPSSISPSVTSRLTHLSRRPREKENAAAGGKIDQIGLVEMTLVDEVFQPNNLHNRVSLTDREKESSLSLQKPNDDLTQSESLSRKSVEETAIPLDLRIFQDMLRDSLDNLRKDHQYSVKFNLLHARQSHDPELLSAKFVQELSPFEAINPRTTTMGKFVRGNGRLEQVITRSGKPATEKLDAPIITYTAEKVTIPPYTNYIATRRNVLVDDDKHRTFLPYHGDDAWVDPDYADLESKISRNRTLYHKLNALEEQARLHRPHAEKFITDVGCSMSDILYYLLDESNPPVPGELPTGLESVWLNRQSHITEDYYEDSDDSESTTSHTNRQDPSKQPKKQWQAMFERVSQPPKGRVLAAAGLACTAFLNVTGFSLWHIAKKNNLLPEIVDDDTKSDDTPYDTIRLHDDLHESRKEVNKLDTYAELVCLICFANECPGHGEFEDNGDGTSTRIRINAEPLSRSASTFDENMGIARFDASAIRNALGQDADGSVSGQSLVPMRGFDHAFRDDEVCSTACFWVKTNRSVEVSEFSKQEMKDFITSLPAYYNDRRGACMLALFINKPCVEIYLKLLMVLPGEISQPVKLKNQDKILSHRAPGKPHSGEWWHQNSRTWKHHERQPFRPCDHAGPCTSTTGCTCFEDEVTCEKSCMCAGTCPRRYQGCTCAAKGRACWDNERCDCFRLHRECDPDLCRSCGACDVLDPANRYRVNVLAAKCINVYIQRGVPSRTLLGHSKLLASGNLSGWGLYSGQPLRKGDYIGEYVGEVVTSEEGERRGVVYDKRNMSYLFDLNSSQTLDSTRVGNKLRYINHQGDPYANCKAKVLLCGTVQRIGMFACQTIAVGDEILFDYGESFTQRFELIKLDENAQPKIEKGKNANSNKKKLVNVKVTSKKTGRPLGRPRKYPLPEDIQPKPLKAQVMPVTQPSIVPTPTAGRATVMDPMSTDTDGDEPPRPSRKRKQSDMTVSLDGAADEEVEDAVPEDDEISSSDSYHESGDGEEDEEEDEADEVIPPPKDAKPSYITPQKRGWETRYANMKNKQKLKAAFSRRTTRVTHDVASKATQKRKDRTQMGLNKEVTMQKLAKEKLPKRLDQEQEVLFSLEEGKQKHTARKSSRR